MSAFTTVQVRLIRCLLLAAGDHHGLLPCGTSQAFETRRGFERAHFAIRILIIICTAVDVRNRRLSHCTFLKHLVSFGTSSARPAAQLFVLQLLQEELDLCLVGIECVSLRLRFQLDLLV